VTHVRCVLGVVGDYSACHPRGGVLSWCWAKLNDQPQHVAMKNSLMYIPEITSGSRKAVGASTLGPARGQTEADVVLGSRRRA